jgi:6-phosphogluconolactonase (cycloisomerase 2 family)
LGQNAYADQLGEISTFKIDPATGALTDLGKAVPDTLIAGDQDPGQFAVDPRGHFLFAMDSSVNEVLTYKIHSADGSLYPANATAAGAGVDLERVVIDPAGRFLYVETIEGIDAFLVNAATGNLTKTGHIDAFVDSFAVDGSGSFLYVLSSPPSPGETLAAYAIDQSSGALSPVKNLAPVTVSVFSGEYFMTISPESGYLYVSDSHAQAVREFQFDPTKPALTELSPPTPEPGATFSLTFDPGGGFLYLVAGNNNVSLFSVLATGALKPLATPTTAMPVSIVAEPTGRFLYLGSFPALTVTGYKLSSSNGALTQLPGAPPVVKGALTVPGTY